MRKRALWGVWLLCFFLAVGARASQLGSGAPNKCSMGRLFGPRNARVAPFSKIESDSPIPTHSPHKSADAVLQLNSLGKECADSILGGGEQEPSSYRVISPGKGEGRNVRGTSKSSPGAISPAEPKHDCTQGGKKDAAAERAPTPTFQRFRANGPQASVPSSAASVSEPYPIPLGCRLPLAVHMEPWLCVLTSPPLPAHPPGGGLALQVLERRAFLQELLLELLNQAVAGMGLCCADEDSRTQLWKWLCRWFPKTWAGLQRTFQVVQRAVAAEEEVNPEEETLGGILIPSVPVRHGGCMFFLRRLVRLCGCLALPPDRHLPELPAHLERASPQSLEVDWFEIFSESRLWPGAILNDGGEFQRRWTNGFRSLIIHANELYCRAYISSPLGEYGRFAVPPTLDPPPRLLQRASVRTVVLQVESQAALFSAAAELLCQLSFLPHCSGDWQAHVFFCRWQTEWSEASLNCSPNDSTGLILLPSHCAVLAGESLRRQLSPGGYTR